GQELHALADGPAPIVVDLQRPNAPPGVVAEHVSALELGRPLAVVEDHAPGDRLATVGDVRIVRLTTGTLVVLFTNVRRLDAIADVRGDVSALAQRESFVTLAPRPAHVNTARFRDDVDFLIRDLANVPDPQVSCLRV